MTSKPRPIKLHGNTNSPKEYAIYEGKNVVTYAGKLMYFRTKDSARHMLSTVEKNCLKKLKIKRVEFVE